MIKKFRPTASLSSKQDSSTQKQYTTFKERQEYSTKTDGDYGYGSTTRFRPIEKDVSGAKAIRVQDIPNGAVGRPVEFESKKFLKMFNQQICKLFVFFLLQLMDHMLVLETWKFW